MYSNRLMHLWTAVILIGVLTSSASFAATHLPERSSYSAPRASVAPTVDGIAAEPAWSAAPWRSIDARWLGPEFDGTDFAGRYKVVWTAERLFLLVEIVDDILIDTHRDPLIQYWDDDCLEIFLDEDYSGGDHQYNHNAFAYHLSLDNRAVDIGTDRAARDYTHHVESRWRQDSDKITWEVSILVYADSYIDASEDNAPVTLAAGKTLGLMLAYCDNDGSELRENFIGSEKVTTGATDRGWIDAGLFGKLTLSE